MIRKDVQGLRALAVLSVVFFHFNALLSGGFVGVDMFFVISGFVITRSIIKRRDKIGYFSITDFYSRRIRRIFPALIVFIILTATITMFSNYLLGKKEIVQLLQSGSMAIFGFSNYFFASIQDNYFKPSATAQLFLHTWSLGVEEQFYLLVSILLIIPLIKRYFFQTMCVLGIASLIFSVYETYTSPIWAFYEVFTRIYEFTLGIAIVYVLRNQTLSNKIYSHLSKKWFEIMPIVGIVCLIASVFLFSKKLPFPSFYALLPTLGTALIIFGNSYKNTYTKKLLSLAPIAFIGNISYSLYLYITYLFYTWVIIGIYP